MEQSTGVEAEYYVGAEYWGWSKVLGLEQRTGLEQSTRVGAEYWGWSRVLG